jgi:hypothetical protein
MQSRVACHKKRVKIPGIVGKYHGSIEELGDVVEKVTSQISGTQNPLTKI